MPAAALFAGSGRALCLRPALTPARGRSLPRDRTYSACRARQPKLRQTRRQTRQENRAEKKACQLEDSMVCHLCGAVHWSGLAAAHLSAQLGKQVNECYIASSTRFAAKLHFISVRPCGEAGAPTRAVFAGGVGGRTRAEPPASGAN